MNPANKDTALAKEERLKFERLVITDERLERPVERRITQTPEPGFGQRAAVNRGEIK